MQTKVYDYQRAAQLIPLLRSILIEIRERTESIQRGELALHAASEHDQTSVECSKQIANSHAELANHRRELRRANQELARLGCAMDQDHPLRILIPGSDGGIEGGFALTDADESLQSTSTPR